MFTRYYGKIGFGLTIETVPGVWLDKLEERYYFGDIVKNVHRWENSQNLNDDINISNQISIIADPFAFSHLTAIKYAEFAGNLWKVTSVEIQSPRLILTLGGVYNE